MFGRAREGNTENRDTEKSNQISDSTIKNLNSKLDDIFKSSEMKMRTLNINNDSTTICSKNLTTKQDVLRHPSILNRAYLGVSAQKYNSRNKDRTTVFHVNTSGSVGKDKNKAFKKKRKETRVSRCDSILNQQQSGSRRNKPIQYSPDISKEKILMQKNPKGSILQRIFSKEKDSSANSNCKKNPSLRESSCFHAPKKPHKEKYRYQFDSKSLVNSIARDPDMKIVVAPKKSKKISRKIFDNKRKSQEAPKVIEKSKRLYSFEFKRASHVSRSIVNTSFNQSRVSRDLRKYNFQYKKISPNKGHHSVLEKSGNKHMQGKKSGLMHQNSKNLNKFFAKKHSEPINNINPNRELGLFEKKKRSIENRLHDELRMKGIESVNSHRQSMTIECIKNILKKNNRRKNSNVDSKFFIKRNQKSAIKEITTSNNNETMVTRIWESNGNTKRIQMTNPSEKNSIILPPPMPIDAKVQFKRKSINKTQKERNLIAESCCLDIDHLMRNDRAGTVNWNSNTSKLQKARSIAGEYLTTSLKTSHAKSPLEMLESTNYQILGVSNKPKQKLTPYLLFDVSSAHTKSKKKPV